MKGMLFHMISYFINFFIMSYPMNSLGLKKIIMQAKEFEEGWDLMNYDVCVLYL
jgi:hypothetical protein